MADPAKKGQALEEDDEFEEFEVEEWSVREEDVKDPRLWDKAWDDDSVNDPLGRQLREKLPAAIQQQQQQQQAPVQ